MDGLRQYSEVEGDREEDHAIATYGRTLEMARSQCRSVIDPTQMYEKLRSFGLDYQDSFASVESCTAGPYQALGTVGVPNTAATMPNEFEHSHIIHPATLDSCLQLIFPSLLNAQALKEPMVPTFIEDLTISADVCRRPGETLTVHASAASAGERAFKANLTASVTPENILRRPMIDIRGLTCTTIPGGISAEGHALADRHISHKMQWATDVDLLIPATSRNDVDSSKVLPSSTSCLDEMAQYVSLLGHKKPYLRILEISGGAGGAAKAILEAIASRKKYHGRATMLESYHYSDKSKDALEGARSLLEPWRDLMIFREFDITSDPVEQGLESGTYDLLVATNLHSTSKLSHTAALKNAHKLLKPGGKILLTGNIRTNLHDSERPELAVNGCRGMFSMSLPLPILKLTIPIFQRLTISQSSWGHIPLIGTRCFPKMDSLVSIMLSRVNMICCLFRLQQNDVAAQFLRRS